MAGNNEITVVGKLTREYLEKFPAAASRAIARMLVRDHPKVFPKLELANQSVRRYRGAQGSLKRREASAYIIPREELPKSYAKPHLPIAFAGRGKGLVLSDIHVPYHDEAALYAALEHAHKVGYLDFVLLNGDILDCYQLSKFERDPRERSFVEELEAVKALLDSLSKASKTVWYKLGNHERRFESYMMGRAPEMLGVEEFELCSLLHADDYGVKVIHDTAAITCSALTVLHGHEYPGGFVSPVNPARGMFLKAGGCTLTGHQHRTSQHNQSTVRGDLVSCWSTGCLCDKHPRYAPFNNWDHGFALLDYDGKWFECQTKRIVKGRVV